MSPWVLSVGKVCSAGGARSPLAGIISTVDYEINRHQVRGNKFFAAALLFRQSSSVVLLNGPSILGARVLFLIGKESARKLICRLGAVVCFG